MGYGMDRGFGYPQSPREVSICDLAEEMVRAREKFPKNASMFVAAN